MKFFTLIATTLLLSSSTFASCYDAYSQKNKELQTKIEESNLKKSQVEASLLSSASYTGGMITITGATTNPFLFITGHYVTQYAAKKISEYYLDFRVSDDIQEAVKLYSSTSTSLALLKEAQVGNGPMLQKAMGAIYDNISTDITLKRLASTIKSQDAQGLYCESEDTMLSHEGILKLAIDEIALTR